MIFYTVYHPALSAVFIAYRKKILFYAYGTLIYPGFEEGINKLGRLRHFEMCTLEVRICMKVIC